MKVLIQRVTEASVTIRETGDIRSIGKGMVVFLGVGYEDSDEDIEYLCKKISALRIFDDSEGIMNLAIGDIEGGELLVVSQFTLMADTSRGNRPGYSKAARGEVSQPLYESFVKQIRHKSGCRVVTGVFGADMLVQIHNDGPVTILIDSKQK